MATIDERFCLFRWERNNRYVALNENRIRRTTRCIVNKLNVEHRTPNVEHRIRNFVNLKKLPSRAKHSSGTYLPWRIQLSCFSFSSIDKAQRHQYWTFDVRCLLFSIIDQTGHVSGQWLGCPAWTSEPLNPEPLNLKTKAPTQKTRNTMLPEAPPEPAVCPKAWGAAPSNAGWGNL